MASEDNNIHLLVEQLDSLKIDLTLRVDFLLKTTSPAEKVLNHAFLKAYEVISKKVQSSFANDLDIAFNDLKDQDPGNVKSHCTTSEKFRKDIQPKILAIQLQLADQLTMKEENQCPSITKKGIEMKKSKAPSFSGKTIDYPEFKRGWQKVAGVCWEDESK
jgi:hypothetical protein